MVVAVMQVLAVVGCRAVVECLPDRGYRFAAVVVHVGPESLPRQSLRRFRWCVHECLSHR